MEVDRIFAGVILNDVFREDYVIQLRKLWVTPSSDPRDPRGVYLIDRDDKAVLTLLIHKILVNISNAQGFHFKVWLHVTLN